MEEESAAAAAGAASGSKAKQKKQLPTFNFAEYNDAARSFNEDQAQADYEIETAEGIFPESFSFIEDTESPKPKTVEELLVEKEAREVKLAKLVKYERDFSKEGVDFLQRDEEAAYAAMRRKKIRGPVALLQIAGGMSGETRQRKLLEYLMSYKWIWFKEYAPEKRVPGCAASLLLDLDLTYLREQDFSRPETLNLSALFHVLGHIKNVISIGDYYDVMPMSDPGDPLFHFDSDVRGARQQIITWHINTENIPPILFTSKIERVLEEASRLSKSTTYGFFGEYKRSLKLKFDLLYQFLSRGYVGLSQKSGKKIDGSTSYQHLWLHPKLPISVRVKDTGQFSIGVLREMPFSDTGKINTSFLTMGAQSEILKASDVHLIPARCPSKGKVFYDLWDAHEDTYVRGLMATAHFRFGMIDRREKPIESPYFNFARARMELE